MEWLIPPIFLVLILVAISLNKNQKENELTYKQQNSLFTPAERSFYGILEKVVEDRFVVFGKVRVADLLKPAKGLSRSDWQRSFNKIFAKHFDFVLCNPDTLQAHCVVELDDASHKAKKRADRDKYLDSACLSAGLKIHHFNTRVSYKPNDIRAVIFSDLNA